MDFTAAFQFCSSGEVGFGFERTAWENQFGNGYGVELNLRWFSFTLEAYFGIKDDEAEPGEQ
jgi:hypothetical protein